MQEDGADKVILGKAHFLGHVCLVDEGVLGSLPLFSPHKKSCVHARKGDVIIWIGIFCVCLM